MFDYIFAHLGITSEGCVDHPVVLTEPVCNPNYCRQRKLIPSPCDHLLIIYLLLKPAFSIRQVLMRKLAVAHCQMDVGLTELQLHPLLQECKPKSSNTS